MTAPARREVVREMIVRGLSERRALRIVRMSASSRRYTPARDRNTALRAQIVALAHRHRRYGAGMIYLKLRQAGERVNHKRVDRIYTAERLQIRRRRRKKVPVADRQPRALGGLAVTRVLDQLEGRVLKCLAMVDDATTEAVAIVPARRIQPIILRRLPHCGCDCAQMSVVIMNRERHLHYHCSCCRHVWMERERRSEDGLRQYRPQMSK